MRKLEKTKYAADVTKKLILSKLRVDLPEIEKLGYKVQVKELLLFDIVYAETGETALEIVLLPDTVIVWNKEEMSCSTEQVHVTIKDGIPVAETSEGLIWATTTAA